MARPKRCLVFRWRLEQKQNKNETFRTEHLNEMQLNNNTKQNMAPPLVRKQNEKQNNARANCRNEAKLHVERNPTTENTSKTKRKTNHDLGAKMSVAKLSSESRSRGGRGYDVHFRTMWPSLLW